MIRIFFYRLKKKNYSLVVWSSLVFNLFGLTIVVI